MDPFFKQFEAVDLTFDKYAGLSIGSFELIQKCIGLVEKIMLPYGVQLKYFIESPDKDSFFSAHCYTTKIYFTIPFFPQPKYNGGHLVSLQNFITSGPFGKPRSDNIYFSVPGGNNCFYRGINGSFIDGSRRGLEEELLLQLRSALANYKFIISFS